MQFCSRIQLAVVCCLALFTLTQIGDILGPEWGSLIVLVIVIMLGIWQRKKARKKA